MTAKTYFAGICIAFVGVADRQKQVLSKRINQAGGLVRVLRKLAFPTAKWALVLPAELTHIVVPDEGPIPSRSRFMSDYGLKDSVKLDAVKVVKASWVSKCLETEALVASSAFETTFDGGAAAAENLGKRPPHGSNVAAEGQPPAKKARISKDGAGSAVSPPPLTRTADELMKVWRKVGMGQKKTVLCLQPDGASTSSRVAAFDLDSTLVKPKQKRAHPKDASDWEWMYPTHVPMKLQELYEEGWRIVILSNQKGVKLDKVKVEDVMGRISLVVAALKIPVEAYAATDDDIYRKPRTGMWDLVNERAPADAAQSFFVGDAAGRPAQGTRRKDHGDSDAKFAANVGCTFYTPEEYFLGNRTTLHSGAACLAKLKSPLTGYIHHVAAVDPPVAPSTAATGLVQEAVLLVGTPAVGKTAYCKSHLPTYVWVNQDTLKTRELCMKRAREALRQGKSVVIDATNRSVYLRKVWITHFRESVPPGTPLRLRCVVFDLPSQVALHLNIFRGVNPLSMDPRLLDSRVIFAATNQLEPLAPDEGWDEVVRINRVHISPSSFKTPEEERLFFSYLI